MRIQQLIVKIDVISMVYRGLCLMFLDVKECFDLYFALVSYMRIGVYGRNLCCESGIGRLFSGVGSGVWHVCLRTKINRWQNLCSNKVCCCEFSNVKFANEITVVRYWFALANCIFCCSDFGSWHGLLM